MRLEAAWQFSTARPPAATHQLPGTTTFVRWTDDGDDPRLHRPFDERITAISKTRKVQRNGVPLKDRQQVELIGSSQGWEPERPIWDHADPLTALAHAAE